APLIALAILFAPMFFAMVLISLRLFPLDVTVAVPGWTPSDSEEDQELARGIDGAPARPGLPHERAGAGPHHRGRIEWPVPLAVVVASRPAVLLRGGRARVRRGSDARLLAVRGARRGVLDPTAT